MMTLTRLLSCAAALLAVALVVLPARAGSCGTVTYSGSYYTPTYYTPTYNNYHVEKKITVLEYVPLFAVGYAPPVASVAPAAPAVTAPALTPCEETAKKLQARLDALEMKLNGGSSVPPVKEAAPPPMAPVGGKPAPVLASKCAACHDTANAAGRGKGVVLFDGGAPTAWSAELAGKVLKEVSSGRMPKGTPLSAADFASCAQEIFDVSSR